MIFLKWLCGYVHAFLHICFILSILNIYSISDVESGCIYNFFPFLDIYFQIWETQDKPSLFLIKNKFLSSPKR